MKNNFIPDGFLAVSPYFRIENARGFIEFLCNAFSAEIHYVKNNEEGLVDHALLSIGNANLEVCDAKQSLAPQSFSFQLFVEDCDKVFEKAISVGANSLQEPEDKAYGVRAGYIQDAWGNQWYISTQIKNRYKPAFWKILEEQYS